MEELLESSQVSDDKIKNQRTKDISLMMMVGFGAISVELLLPSIIDISRYFNTNYTTAILIITLYPLGYGLSQLFVGNIADAMGKLKVLYIGIGIYIFSSILCLLATNIYVLIIARVIQSAGACTGPLISRAIVRELYSSHNVTKKLGKIISIMGFAPCLAPLLGGLLTHYFGWRSNFVFMMVFAVITILITKIALSDFKENISEQPTISNILRSYKPVLTTKNFLVMTIIIGIIYGVFFGVITSFPILIHQLLHIPTQNFALYFLGFIFFYALGAFLISKVAHHLNLKISLQLLILVLIASSLLSNSFYIRHIYTYISVFSPLCLLAFLVGLLLPMSMSLALDFMTSNAGTASGLIGFFQMIFASIISVLFSYIFNSNLLLIHSFIIITLAICLAIFKIMEMTYGK